MHNKHTIETRDEGWRPSMAQSLGRVEGKIDQLLAAQMCNKETADDHEGRIRTLEKGAWKRAGFIAALSSVGGAAVAMFTKYGVIPS